MSGLAFHLLRHRMGGAVATFVALAVGVVILMACGVFLESGLRYHGKSDPTRRVIDSRTFIKNLESLTRYLAAVRPER